MVGGGGNGSTPVSFTHDLAAQVDGPGIGFAPGQCPMIAPGQCGYDGSIPCNIYRECDPYTGMTHGSFTLPGVNAKPGDYIRNGWLLNNGNWVWVDAAGNVTTPPSYASPPSLDPSGSIYQPSAQLQAATPAGMKFVNGSGWVPIAGNDPPELTPTIPAYTQPAVTPTGVSPNNRAANALPTNNVGTAAGTGPTTGGVNKNIPANTGAAAPGQVWGNNTMLLIAAAVVLVLILK